jgi:hypothetical protein
MSVIIEHPMPVQARAVLFSVFSIFLVIILIIDF